MDDGTSYLGCKRCGAKLSNKGGFWKADVPEKSDRMHGYVWSGLILPHADPGEILHHYRYPPQGNIGDIMRTELGMAYISSEDQLTRADVLSCCGNYPQRDTHSGPCAMGVDMGDVKHYVVGIRTGPNTIAILKVGKTRKMEEIEDLAHRMNVRSEVMDLRPFADTAREHQRRMRHKVWLCEYSESTPMGTIYNEQTGLVKPNRTEIFDQSGRLFREGIVEIPRRSPEIDEFVKQVTDPTCVEERDKRRNVLVRRYRGTNDHYRNALNYLCLAAGGGKVGIAGDGGRRRRGGHARNDYSRVAV